MHSIYRCWQPFLMYINICDFKLTSPNTLMFGLSTMCRLLHTLSEVILQSIFSQIDCGQVSLMISTSLPE